MPTGKFIVFEGIDGSGKTTQVNLLAAALSKQGETVVCTREPGGTRVGDVLRGMLLNPAYRDLSPRAEAFLYAADRAQHVAEVIMPALQRGETVICDRYIYSTLAYQGGGRDIDRDFLMAVNKLACAGLLPDAVILLDLDVDVALRRALRNRPPDRLEEEHRSFFERVRQCYLDQAALDRQVFSIIEADAPEQMVHQRIIEALGRG